MSKQYYDENGNPVEVKKNRGGCLKWIIGIVVILIIFVACSAMLGGESENTTTENTEESTAVTEQSSEDTELLSIGETATIGDYEVTITNAYFTDERNEFAEEEPEQVIAIEYTLDNNSDEDYPFGADMQLYVDGTQASSYPLGSDFGSVSAGRTVEGTAYYGVNGENIELEWQPIFDFEGNKAIWNIEAQ